MFFRCFLKISEKPAFAACRVYKRGLSVLQNPHLIPRFCGAFLQNHGEDPFSGHHTVSCLLTDCTVRMTFFPDLCHLTQRCPDL